MYQVIGHLLVAAFLGLCTTGVSADFPLRVLHTNDFHARIEPINKYDSDCSDEDRREEQCFGGSARMAVAIAAAREKSKNSVLLDGGDQFQGSLFYTHYKGKAVAEFMNLLGYDAMTVGNHEFDDGPEVLAAFMETIEFPILMSNADISQEPALAGKLARSSVIERDGVRIGLIGLTPQDTAELASPGDRVMFTDPVKATREEVAKLTADGIKIVIVLSHSGYGLDKFIANKVADIDVIVGGHSNTLLSNQDDRAVGPYPTMVGNTAIVQAYAYGKYLGVLDLNFDDKGVITNAVGEPVLLDASIGEDAAFTARIDELAQPLETIRNTVVSRAGQPINGNRDDCRVRECAMGNLVADAMLARVKSQGVTIAIQNGGGLRASIDEGDITMGEVLSVLPFQNTLSTFRLTGASVVAALENGVSQVEAAKGRFPQVAGVRFTWTRSVQPNEGRILTVMVEQNASWVNIDPVAIYGVVSNNFLRAGGDGYAVLANDAIDAYDFGPGIDKVVADYLADNAPYAPYLDGRIEEKTR